MKLYNSNLSPFAACVRMVVYAKGIESEIEVVPPAGGGLKSPEYLAINPIGKVPSLRLDGLDGWTLPESIVICEYLEDRFPEPRLRPQGADDRARMRLLMRLVDLYLYPGLLVLFQQLAVPERSQDKIAEAFRNLDQACTHIEHWFGGGSHAVGDRWTLADCVLLPALFYVRSMSRAFQREPFAGHPRLGAYFERASVEPAAARVLGEMKAAVAERRQQQAAAAR